MEKHLEAFEELIIQLIGWQSHKKGWNFAECFASGACAQPCELGGQAACEGAQGDTGFCISKTPTPQQRGRSAVECSVTWNAGL